MIFSPTELPGAMVVELERYEDERGFFARTWCAREFEAHGLAPCVAQCSVARNTRRGTLRGMHWQDAPHAEDKLVSCIQGRLLDVIVDLRPASATHLRWIAVELFPEGAALYVPKGFAHGYQTLDDDTTVAYLMSEFYAPESARGARFDDPAFGIEWPLVPPPVISERDRNWPDYVPSTALRQ